jgi:exopolysaccharide biosynthesis protein
VRCNGLIAALGLAGTAAVAQANPGNVSFQYHKFGHFNTYVVTANLNDPDIKVTPILSRWGIGSSESFHSMLHRTNPTAAITGTFFSPDNLLPTGDIVLGGRFVYFGGIGHAIAITPENKATILRRRPNRHADWSGYETILCAGPRLIWNGKVYVNPRAEGFRDRHMMYSKTMRLGIGITRYNRLMFVAVKTPCYLSQLGRIMRKLGCTNAVNVDQGSSSAFYCRGHVVAHPGRSLTNLLAIYDRQRSFLSAMNQIAPWYVASR